MDELMKSLGGGDKDDLTKHKSAPREVHGVLAVHIKSIKLISSETFELHASMLGLLQVRVSVGGHTKIFSVNKSPAQDEGTVMCDQLKHFVIKLHEKINHCSNQLIIELVISSPLLPGKVSPIARAQLHIPNLLHQCLVSGECTLKSVDTLSSVALVFADWAFCYGSYGYGESYQLRHHNNNNYRASDYLHFSLLPRIIPSNVHADFNGLILTPHVMKHPTYIPFNDYAYLCGQESMTREQDNTKQQLSVPMKRLHLLHKQLRVKSTDRKEKLQFLKELVLSASDKQEDSIGSGVTSRKPH